MKRVWKILNNKKTNIGASLMLGAVMIPQIATIWSGGSSPEWALMVAQTLETIGGLVAGIGLSHKGLKTMYRGGEQ